MSSKVTSSLHRSLPEFDLDKTNQTKELSHLFCHQTWGLWPKEKLYTYIIEETGEFIDELLDSNYEWQLDELGDLIFGYLTYLNPEYLQISEEEKYSVLRYVVQKIKWVNYTQKDLLLLFISELSKENKISRKLDGTKSNYDYTELDVKKSKVLNLYCLHLLTTLYKDNIDSVVKNSLNKWSDRDWSHVDLSEITKKEETK